MKIFKRVFPRQLFILLKKKGFRYKKISLFFERVTLSTAVISPIFSSLYYAIVSPQFRREHHAVIQGKLRYYANLKSAQDSIYLLRRNTHRLEKGLVMRPRRDIFALDYIEETVNTYSIALKHREKISQDNSELRWTHDVLKEYFTVISSHPIIDKAKEKFLALEPLKDDHPRIPYKRSLSPPLVVDYDQFLKLCYQRRSVRWYEQKPVPRDLIDKAIKAAALSPSACNRQPFKFRVFDDPELVQKVASIPGGTQGFYHNFPAIIVVVGQLRAYFSERDRHIIYIDASLASMSLMYALETLGLSSCPINWPDIEEKEQQMSNCLNLSPDERPVMLISVGYSDSDGMIPYSQKKTLDQIRSYN